MVATAGSGSLKPGKADQDASVQTSIDRERSQRTAVRRAIRMDRVPRLCALLGTFWVVGYALAVRGTAGNEAGERILHYYVYLLPVALATVLSFAVAAKRRTRSVGRFWTLLALSNAGWLAGELISGGYALTGTEQPFPSIADAAYLGSYAVIAVAVISAFRGTHLLTHGRALLDVLAPVIVFGVAGWELLLEPQVSGGWSLATLVGMAYPLAGVVIACLLISLGFTGRTFVPISITCVAGALAITAVTDAGYTHGVVLHGYVSGGWLNIGWQAEAVIMCCAAVVALRHHEPDSEDAPLGSDRGLIPLMLAMAAALGLVAVTVTNGILSKESLAALIAAVSLVLIRLYLSTRAMRSLAEALEQARAEQERLAVTDVLTGLYNRRFVEELLRIETDRARRTKAHVGLVVLDIDYFKLVNDRFGHAAGDRVLAEVAERLRAALRPSDILARYGGEEFVAVVPDGSSEATLEVAERLRVSVQESPIAFDGNSITVTVSAGVAAMSEWDDLDAMLRAADRALYAAKDSGRNRVHLASDESPPAADASEVPAGLARIADVVDSRICGDPHSKPMAVWAGVVADRLGLDPQARRVAVVACRLHDIGKVAVPDSILSKPNSLSDEEWEIMRTHSNEGARMLVEFPGLDGVAEAVKAHHERFDGSGYPDRLAGGDIPLAARIISVCDAWATMLANRPYGMALTRQNSRDELERCKATQFDPGVVDAFLELELAGLVGNLRIHDGAIGIH
jgi:diguanylate cyclase (GGDEF)-like protein